MDATVNHNKFQQSMQQSSTYEQMIKLVNDFTMQIIQEPALQKIYTTQTKISNAKKEQEKESFNYLKAQDKIEQSQLNYDEVVKLSKESNERLAKAIGLMFSAAKNLSQDKAERRKTNLEAFSVKLEAKISNFFLNRKVKKETKQVYEKIGKADAFIEKRKQDINFLSANGMDGKELSELLTNQIQDTYTANIEVNPHDILETLTTQNKTLLGIYTPTREITALAFEELTNKKQKYEADILSAQNDKKIAFGTLNNFNKEKDKNDKVVMFAEQFVEQANEQVELSAMLKKDAAKELFASLGQSASAGLSKKFTEVKNFFTQMKNKHTMKSAVRNISRQENSINKANERLER